jgi:hypothetical protein
LASLHLLHSCLQVKQIIIAQLFGVDIIELMDEHLLEQLEKQILNTKKEI